MMQVLVGIKVLEWPRQGQIEIVIVLKWEVAQVWFKAGEQRRS